jgi:hypothetical protein
MGMASTEQRSTPESVRVLSIMLSTGLSESEARDVLAERMSEREKWDLRRNMIERLDYRAGVAAEEADERRGRP